MEHVTILDTDYEKYAVLITCSEYALFHTKYAILLSREQNISDGDIKKVS